MSALSLIWKQFNQERWPALVLALSVALLSAVAGAVPRLMSDLDDRQLAQALSGLSAAQGDVTGSWSFDPYNSPVLVPDEGPDPWVSHREAALAIRDAQPEPLRSALAEPQFVGTLSPDVIIIPPAETGYYRATFQMLTDPQIEEHVELVSGDWPETVEGQRQVLVLDEVATRLQWEIGHEIDESLVLAGTFEPLNPDDRRWEHVPTGRSFFEAADPDFGTEMRSGLFLPPSYSLVSEINSQSVGWGTALTKRVWFGLDPAALRSSGVDVRELSGQLTALLARRHLVQPATDDGVPAVEIRVDSDLNESLERVLAQQATTRSVLLVAAVGPIAVALALVLLASRLVLQRRQPWLELVRARGLDPDQSRWLAALEGAALSVPAAVIGHLAAVALVPGPQPPLAWVGTAAAAALAPAALAVGASRIGTSRARTDLSPRAGRWRIVGEALAVATALAATWQLLTRAGEGVDGVDLLGAAAPVLWTVAVSLLVLRLYPLPLRALARAFKSGRGITGFLGAVRSLRDPAGGYVPIVTVLLGTTLAVMSASILGTLTTGTERAMWETNGSHVRLSGPRILDPMVEDLLAIDGVAGVARIYDAADNAKVMIGEDEVWARVLLADPSLLDVYAETPSRSAVPPSLFDGSALLLGGEISATADTATLVGMDTPRVVGALDTLPGMSPGSAWVLADVNQWTGSVPTSNAALISVEPGADMRAVADAAAQLVPNSRVTDVAAQLDELRDSPTIEGLSRTFIALTAATALLMALGVIGSQLLGSAQRTHLSAILRTLGLRPGQLRALTAWEAGPAIILALVVGVALGIGLTALMLATLDFRSLTGGEHSPALYLHWPSLAAVVGALVATMAVAVAAASWFAGRTNVAQELRIGDQT